MKPKRKRTTTLIKVSVPPPNDGTNTPVPDQKKSAVVSLSEAALYKQAENPLGDPNKV